MEEAFAYAREPYFPRSGSASWEPDYDWNTILSVLLEDGQNVVYLTNGIIKGASILRTFTVSHDEGENRTFKTSKAVPCESITETHDDAGIDYEEMSYQAKLIARMILDRYDVSSICPVVYTSLPKPFNYLAVEVQKILNSQKDDTHV